MTKNIYSMKFAKLAQDKKSLIMPQITLVVLLKSFEVNSKHISLSSEVKSNVIKSMVVDLESF